MSLNLRLSKTAPVLDNTSTNANNNSNNNSSSSSSNNSSSNTMTSSPMAATMSTGGRLSLHLPARATALQTQQLKEEVVKRSKLDQYRHVCSEILPHLYVAAEDVANDREALKRNGITHVINCAGLTIENSFPGEFKYLKLNLYDSREEDIAWFVYEVIDFIEAARQSNGGEGKALLHCVQGVSRSCAFAIAYVMWYTRSDYNTAFTKVKQCRPIASPNSGFICNLLEFQNYLTCQAAPYPFMFRVASHGEHDLEKLVPKPCRISNSRTLLEARRLHLDSRGCFVLQTPPHEEWGGHPKFFVWRGKAATDESFAIARAFVDKVQRLEGWGEEVRVVSEDEPLDPELGSLLDSSSSPDSSSPSDGDGDADKQQPRMDTTPVPPVTFTDLVGAMLPPTTTPGTVPSPLLSLEGSKMNHDETTTTTTTAAAGKDEKGSPTNNAARPRSADKEQRGSLLTIRPDLLLDGGVANEKPILYRAELNNEARSMDVADAMVWSWEKIGVYDADDLCSDDMFFLRTRPGASSFLWLGAGFEPPPSRESETKDSKLSPPSPPSPEVGGEGSSTRAASHEEGQQGKDPRMVRMVWAQRMEMLSYLASRFEVEAGHIVVQGEGSESEGFWTAFEEGY